MTEQHADISDLASTARRLREARLACRQFLKLWAVQRLEAHPDHLDRIAVDVQREFGHVEEQSLMQFLAETTPHDWSLLYPPGSMDD